MDYWKEGQHDGICQAKMDNLTETKRESEDIAYSAMGNMDVRFSSLSKISQVYYTCGFVNGYLLTVFEKGI